MKHSLLHTNTKWESVKMRCLKNGFEASLFALLMCLGLLIQSALFCDLFSQFFGLCRHSEAVAALLRPKMSRVLLSFCNKDYFSLQSHSLLMRIFCPFDSNTYTKRSYSEKSSYFTKSIWPYCGLYYTLNTIDEKDVMTIHVTPGNASMTSC